MDLRSYLDQSGVKYQWLHHDMAYTAQELAQREHTSGRKVIKPVLVEADGKHLLCALPAAYQVDLERVRQQVNASEAKLADEQTMQQVFKDCDIGAEPPIGGMFGLPTLLDESIEAQDEVTFQAGTHQDAVRMSVDDYMRVAHPQVASFRR